MVDIGALILAVSKLTSADDAHEQGGTTRVTMLISQFNFDLSIIPRDFEMTYAFSLILWGARKPLLLLEFFKRESVRATFREVFLTNNLFPIRKVSDLITRPSEEGIVFPEQEFDVFWEFHTFGIALLAVINWATALQAAPSAEDINRITQLIDEIPHSLLGRMNDHDSQQVLNQLIRDNTNSTSVITIEPSNSLQETDPQPTLLTLVAAETNLKKAWIKTRFYASTNLQYYDKTAYDDFETFLDANLLFIQHLLLSREFHFSPLRIFEIPKGDGVRAIYFAQPYDALVTQAILNIVGPSLENKIPEASFGHRLNYESTESKEVFRPWPDQFKQYISKIRGTLKETKEGWYQISDLANFYPSINRAILKGVLSTVVQDADILLLIAELIDRSAVDLSEELTDFPGLPPGPAYAHVFANVYLRDFDLLMSEKGLHYFRYVDDFCFFCTNQEEMELVNDSLISLFRDRYEGSLCLNPKKTEQQPITNPLPLIEHTAKMKYDLRFGVIDSIEADISIKQEVEEAKRNAEILFKSLFLKAENAEDLSQFAVESAGFIASRLQEFIISEDEAQAIAYGLLELNPPKISATRALVASLMDLTFAQAIYLDRFIEFISESSDIIKITFLQLLPGFFNPPSQVLNLLLGPFVEVDNYLVRKNTYLVLRAHEYNLTADQFRTLRTSESSDFATLELVRCITLIRETEKIWIELIGVLTHPSVLVFNAGLMALYEGLIDESIPPDNYATLAPTIHQRVDKTPSSLVVDLTLACQFGNEHSIRVVRKELGQLSDDDFASRLVKIVAFQTIRFHVTNSNTSQLFGFSDLMARLSFPIEALTGFQELAQSSDPNVREQAIERRTRLDQSAISAPGLPDWYTLEEVDKGLYCELSDEPSYRCRYYVDLDNGRTGTLEIISAEMILSDQSFPSINAWMNYLHGIRSFPIVEIGVLANQQVFVLYEIPDGYIPLNDWHNRQELNKDESSILRIGRGIVHTIEKTRLATGFEFSNLSPCNVLWNPTTSGVLLINVGSCFGVPKYVCGLGGCKYPQMRREIGTTTGSYFLGLLLLQLLTYSCSIEAIDSQQSTSYRKQNGRTIIDKLLELDLTPHFRSVITRLLHRNPEYRYPVIGVLTGDIDHILQFKRLLAKLTDEIDIGVSLIVRKKLTLVDFVQFRFMVGRRNPALVHLSPMTRTRLLLNTLSQNIKYYEPDSLFIWDTQANLFRERRYLPRYRNWIWLQAEAKHSISLAIGWLRLLKDLDANHGIKYPFDLVWLLIANAVYEETMATIQSILVLNYGRESAIEQCSVKVQKLLVEREKLDKLRIKPTNKQSAEVFNNAFFYEHFEEALQIVNNSLTRDYWHFSFESHSLGSLFSIVFLFCSEFDIIDENNQIVVTTEKILLSGQYRSDDIDLWIIMQQPVELENRLKHITDTSDYEEMDSESCWTQATETFTYLRKQNTSKRKRVRLSKYSLIASPRQGRILVRRFPWSRTEIGFNEYDVLTTGDIAAGLGKSIKSDIFVAASVVGVSAVLGEPNLFRNLLSKRRGPLQRIQAIPLKWRIRIILVLLALATYIVIEVLGLNGTEAIQQRFGVALGLAYVFYFFIWIISIVVGDLLVESFLTKPDSNK